MDPATIVQLALVLGIVLVVLAIGLRTSPVDPLLVVRDPGLAARSMAAMFVVMPILVLLLVRFLPLRPGVGAALLGLAVAPMLPPWAKKGIEVGGQGDYVFGLQILASLIAILVVPAMIWVVRRVFDVDTPLDPWAIEKVLLITVGAPLAAGIGIARAWPGVAPRIAALSDRIGLVLLLLGVAALLFARWRDIAAVFGQGTLVVTLLFIASGLLVGHLLGGPDPGNRGALATATASRHPAVALVLASTALPGSEPAVVGTVLLYLFASMALTVPYQRWRLKVIAPPRSR